jgi:hypothetical protein
MGEQGSGNPQYVAMQLLQENNQMLRAIGAMLQELMGAEQQEAGIEGGAPAGADEAALREEAMRRLAAQG